MRAVLASLVIVMVAGALVVACGVERDPATVTPAATSTGSSEATTSPGAPTGSSTEVPAAANEIVAAVFNFTPASLEVTAGTTVTWRNTDQILHTATAGTPDAPSDEFDGQMDGAGTSFSHTFNEPGTFAFYCARHEHMRGEVTVR